MSSSAGTTSTTRASDGRESTSPIAPSSSWCATRTTVRRKFGSISAGDETSRCPWSDSTQPLYPRVRAKTTLRERPALAGAERLQDAAGDHHPVHLVRPVVDPAGARLHRHPRERRLVGEAARAVNLDRAVDHRVQDAGGVELDDRDLDARFVAGVDLVRGVERHEPARLDLGGAVGDPVLDGLLLGERRAERLAL